ncbi:MAG: polyhydroxyalkanoic acid system family protein [Myxococcales bacterium]|nr:polyhydroxyalkanoic acid system family protein [Myxococcales bacterium]
MKHVVHHGLGLETAKKVADAAFASYQQRFSQYHPQARWVNDQRAEITFKVKGMALMGSLEVNERDIEMDLEVPFVLRPFKGKAIGLIEEEIKKWIDKAKSGQL